MTIMNNKFDELLFRKIKSSFSELEIDYEPEQWELVKKRLAKKPLIFIPWNSLLKYAAVILLTVTFAFYLFNLSVEENNKVSISQEISPPQNNPPRIEKRLPSIIPPPDNTINDQDELENLSANTNTALEENNDLNDEYQNLGTTFSVSNILVENNRSTTDDITFANLKTSDHQISTIYPIIQASDLKRPVRKHSISASSNVGFSEAENNVAVGFSGGFSQSFPVTNKMAISSGLGLSQSNLLVKNNGDEVTESSQRGAFQEIVKAELLAIDIPLNIKYNFHQWNSNQLFISAGISSLIYLKQNFSTTIREVIGVEIINDKEQVIIVDEFQERKSSSSEPSFSKIDPAQILNISFGYEYALTANQSLIFEPYIKLPLGDLTSRDVRFGSAGLNIKIGL